MINTARVVFSLKLSPSRARPAPGGISAWGSDWKPIGTGGAAGALYDGPLSMVSGMG